MTTPEQDADLGKPNEQMQAELGELLSVARAGELAPTDFLERLESIHARYLGDEALAPEFVSRRGQALAAYDEVRLGVDRHHQLELLAQALGVEL
jgi:hypothetical protein